MALTCSLRADCQTMVATELTVGDLNDVMTDIELEISMLGRRQTYTVKLPVQLKNTVSYNIYSESNQSYRCRTRIMAGKNADAKLDAGIPQM